MWAHPRSRGENAPPVPPLLRDGGSSPLTRGKQRRGIQTVLNLRLIPAHAGKTGTVEVSAWLDGAHPRSRGENFPSCARKNTASGSSPLTRGKRRGGPAPGAGVGLIPAHAGKTTGWACPWRWSRAHPRSRGENLPEDHPEKWAQGSSPLTRGKLPVVQRDQAARGLIPAHAGKTPGLAVRSRSGRAHPRSRGENITNKLKQLPGWGSSPLTRGKRRGDGPCRRARGLIPAHAGKTRPRGL